MLRDPAAGELNRRVIIRRRLDVPAFGPGVESEYPERSPRWAKIEPVGTAAYANGVQTDTKITHRVWIRWGLQVDDACEVVELRSTGNIVYRVQRCAELGGGRTFLVLEVEELGVERV
ncbi:head-tail adaptor protein [Azoarcus indigens]|uniref:Head-tail adaptor n=1 Tax=Azoarcus indigens TaxID=29545 RepID=A0A4R6DYJ8_9RHOO|nr:head-tail adaptor protein [Azoarcus indigens]NMG64889.1 head-tail adaptor protein [Azoarcus indigens]TDN50427.1 head-tail adaptor [Azoarcus indigens]